MAESNKVAVIGGGISGLACAYRLQQLGLPVTLLEAEERAGGLIGTVEKDGFLFESGPQSFQGTEVLLDLIRELGIEGELCKADPQGAAIRPAARQAAENSDVAAGAADEFPAGLRFALESCHRTVPPDEAAERRGIGRRISCGANSGTKFSNISSRHLFPASMRATPKS